MFFQLLLSIRQEAAVDTCFACSAVRCPHVVARSVNPSDSLSLSSLPSNDASQYRTTKKHAKRAIALCTIFITTHVTSTHPHNFRLLNMCMYTQWTPGPFSSKHVHIMDSVHMYTAEQPIQHMTNRTSCIHA